MSSSKYYLEKIRSLRHRNKLSQLDMATELNIEQSTYGRIENGKQLLDVDRALMIARMLGVPISEILNSDAPDVVNEHRAKYNASPRALHVNVRVGGNEENSPHVNRFLKRLGSLLTEIDTDNESESE